MRAQSTAVARPDGDASEQQGKGVLPDAGVRSQVPEATWDRAAAVVATSPRKAVYEMAHAIAHAALVAAMDPALGRDRLVPIGEVLDFIEGTGESFEGVLAQHFTGSVS